MFGVKRPRKETQNLFRKAKKTPKNQKKKKKKRELKETEDFSNY